MTIRAQACMPSDKSSAKAAPGDTHISGMLRVRRMSGQELPAVSMEDIRRVWDLKKSLCQLHGFPICMQELMHNGKTLANLTLLDAPMDIELVLSAPSTAEQLLAAGKELVKACETGSLEVVRSLLQVGVNKDFQNPDYMQLPRTERHHYVGIAGFTPLIVVAVYGHIEITRLLLEGGANRDAQDKRGFSALMCAAEYGHLEIVRILLEGGADKDLQSKGGVTALMRAVDSGHMEIARLLIEAGANKDTQDEDGHTALMLAAEDGQVQICQLLLEAGANKDLKSLLGTTALMLAVDSCHGETAKLLSAKARRV